MATRRRFMLLLGFAIFMFVMFSFHKWDIFQHKRGPTAEQLQERRKQLLRQMCDSNKEAFSEGNRTLEDWNGNKRQNFIVNDKHRIIYCYVPKVACTNWKRIMYVLNGSKPFPDLLSLSHFFIHNTTKLIRLDSFPRVEIKEKLKNYTKFLFVRDPFVRLISAYRDKLEHFRDNYFEEFSHKILKLYGSETETDARPSFYNFIQYLLDPQTEKDGPFEPHWRQVHRLCLPCHIQYDFIGHQETLQMDAEQLLKLLKLENDIKFPPSHENMTSSDSVLGWFRAVPLQDRKKLYKLYEQDFGLFGYRRPDELLNGLFLW